MPAKGSSLKCGERETILSIGLWREFKKESGLDVSYKEFRDVIIESSSEIQDWVLINPLGFKLPENLGYLAITRFKPKKKMVNYIASGKYGKTIPLLNLHSHGEMVKIEWFKDGISDFQKVRIYSFSADRAFKRALADKFREGKIKYNSYPKDYFRRNVKVKKRRIT